MLWFTDKRIIMTGLALNVRSMEFIGLCLEGFLYGKTISSITITVPPETSPRPRTLFCHFRHVFTTPDIRKRRRQDSEDSYPLPYSLSPLFFIRRYFCHGYGNIHTWSK